MSPRRAVWLVCLVLVAVGGLLAHLAAYQLIPAGQAHRVHAVQEAGHGSFVHLRFCLALCAALMLVGLAGIAVDRMRGRSARSAPLWLFALLPPLGFAVQEHLERFLHTGTPTFAMAIEAPFLLGLALQVPFALIAFFAARALLVLTLAIVERLRQFTPRPAVGRALASYSALIFVPSRTSALARGYSERAPPLRA
jgi:uncharacterized membrane protein YhaH (DUF805 family)